MLENGCAGKGVVGSCRCGIFIENEIDFCDYAKQTVLQGVFE